jgi:hypothetical protein
MDIRKKCYSFLFFLRPCPPPHLYPLSRDDHLTLPPASVPYRATTFLGLGVVSHVPSRRVCPPLAQRGGGGEIMNEKVGGDGSSAMQAD